MDPTAPLILEVDADPLIAAATVRLLQQARYRTLPTASGGEALQLAREHHPGLVLLDVMLPDLNGVQVCRQIKAEASLAEVDVVMVSGQITDTDSQARGRESGAYGYIARPELAQVPIIALTALAMPGDRERCLAAGADAYLSKPVSMKMVVEAIRRCLAEKQTVVVAGVGPQPEPSGDAL